MEWNELDERRRRTEVVVVVVFDAVDAATAVPSLFTGMTEITSLWCQAQRIQFCMMNEQRILGSGLEREHQTEAKGYNVNDAVSERKPDRVLVFEIMMMLKLKSRRIEFAECRAGVT